MQSWAAIGAAAAIGFAAGAAVGASWSAPPAVGELSGRWCGEDPRIGCYRFDTEGVTEEAAGGLPEARGRWRVEEGLLQLRFPNGTWTLAPERRTEGVLVLRDLDRDEIVVLVRAEP